MSPHASGTPSIRRWTSPSNGVLLVAALLLAAFAGAPLLAVLRASALGGGRVLASELADAGTASAIGASLYVSLSTTLIAVPLGAGLAWLLVRSNAFRSARARDLVVGVLTLPLAIPPYLLAMAWALLANGKSGILNRVGAAPWIDLYGYDGIVLCLVSSAYPLALLTVRAGLERADPSLEEAARVAGARWPTVLSSVTLPLLRPALAASAGMVFVFAAAAFGVPYLLGANADPPVLLLTTRIFRYTALGGADALARAAALALLLLLLAAGVQLAFNFLAGTRSVVQIGGKTSRPAQLELGPWRRPAALLVLLIALLFVLVPLGTILWTSLLASFSDLGSLTLGQWRDVLHRRETARAFSNSLLLAFGAGSLVALAGVLLARLAGKSRAGRWLAAGAELPYAVPGTVLAIGLLLVFSVEYRLIVFERVSFALALPGTLGLLFVAYVVKYLAIGVRGARAALAQLHPSLAEAARVAGAGALRAERDVVLPLIAPAIGAAFVLVSLPCITELTMSVLLFGVGTETSGTLLFELQSYANPPAASVVASLTVLLAIAGDLVSRALARRASARLGL